MLRLVMCHTRRALFEVARAGSNVPHEPYPNYLDLRDRNHTVEGLASCAFAYDGLDAGDGAELKHATQISLDAEHVEIIAAGRKTPRARNWTIATSLVNGSSRRPVMIN